MKYRYIVGIDEVGRGPLAGPVAVGAVCIERGFDLSFFRGIKDSKKLSAQKREEWRSKVSELAAHATGSSGRTLPTTRLTYTIACVGPRLIDKLGINRAIAKAIKLSITKLGIDPKESLVLLDGGLKAPEPFRHQKTIIRGDEKEAVISLASILAKLHRDKKMERFARTYSGYGFDEHKGYGTAEHLKKIRILGMCDIHRRSFLKNFRENGAGN